MFRSAPFALALVLCAAPMRAQSGTLPVQLDTRVRLWQAGSSAPLRGSLARFDDDSIELHTPDGRVTVARAEVRRLDVGRGIHANTGRGFRRGALIGAGAGAALGILAWSQEKPDDWYTYGAAWIPVGALGGASWGALIGAVVGAASHSEHWERVQLDASRLEPVARRRGSRTELGLAIQF